METPQRIEPALLEHASDAVTDAVAELSAASAALGKALHPRTAERLAQEVRVANAHYSNLIEGHRTRPRDIRRALAGDFDADAPRRRLQVEAAAHVRLQTEIDRLAAAGGLQEPASAQFIRWLHLEFFRGASSATLTVEGSHMEPGAWRAGAEQDGPLRGRGADFMTYFEQRYRFKNLGQAGRIMAIGAAHHRFRTMRAFPDGNGRVCRLMSHAMAHCAGIGAHGLWSIARGLFGPDGGDEYKTRMAGADMPRQGDLDGHGSLSLKALDAFVLWFLRVCIGEVAFMAALFDLDTLRERLRACVARGGLAPQGVLLLEEGLRGPFERGAAGRITGLPEQSAQEILGAVTEAGLLASETGSVSLRFPADALEILFPRLYPEMETM